MFNVPQALLWIANNQVRKFNADDLKARLAYLGESPSLFAVHQMFSKKGERPEANTRSDIQESLMDAVPDPAASIFQNAQDDLLQKLRDGKLAMYGREVPRQARTVPLENGALAVIGYSQGRKPITQPEIIPSTSFVELRFADVDGVEAVPLDFPSREFPRWRDLSVVAGKVRRLWPIKTPSAGGKRGPAPVLMEAVKEKMRRYDPETLRKMKHSGMAAEFGASEGTCAAARRAVQSE